MGTDKDKSRSEAAELRRQAEERLRGKTAELQLPRTGEDAQRLVHELEVHQIELEMQNAELRQARDEVEAVLEKYVDLYDFAPVGYFTLDGEALIRAVNLTGAGLLGVERSRLLGRQFGLFVASEARPAFTAFFGKVFTSPRTEACETELLSEKKHPLFVHMEAVARASGKECRLAVVDITERRRAEEALAEKRREIDELNRSLEVRITRAVDELRQKDQLLIMQGRQAAMGEMINNIAHQWRQPLNMLGLIVQQAPLFYETGELSKEFLEENAAKAMNMIQHMSRTIDDFRNFFRSDKERAAFGVTGAIESTLSLIENNFKDQRIGVELRTEGDPVANGYPNEYAQVLLNILLNAQDVLVGRKIEDALISIHAFAAGSTSVVTITDNAGGIDEEVMDKIFDPYFTTKGADQGTGIGLFMSRTIIEKNMGGRLTVRNTGSGAEFRIEV